MASLQVRKMQASHPMIAMAWIIRVSHLVEAVAVVEYADDVVSEYTTSSFSEYSMESTTEPMNESSASTTKYSTESTTRSSEWWAAWKDFTCDEQFYVNIMQGEVWGAWGDGCSMDADRNCVSSANYVPGPRRGYNDEYNDASCTIDIHVCNLELKFEDFRTFDADILTAGGELYSGIHRPASGTYSQGSILWRPEPFMHTRGFGETGWRFCKTPAPWSITGDGCLMNGDCISSNSDPSSFVVNRTAANDYSWVLGDYGNGQTCTIHITGSLDLSIETFDTEASYDTLTIGGQVYSGDIGPPSAIYSGDIVWRSDSSLVRAGWKI